MHKGKQAQEDNLANSEKKTGEDNFIGFPKMECSLTIQSCGETCSQFEHSIPLNTADFINNITFPQRAKLMRFTNSDIGLAIR